VLTYGDLDRLSDPYPYITSIYPGSNGTFALQSVYVGCVLGNIPGACTISIVGFKNGVKVASTAVTYQPVPGTIPSAMTKVTFPRGFGSIDSVRFVTNFLDRAIHPGLGGATFLDDIQYLYFPAATATSATTVPTASLE
jgi:hypothetical protein